MVSTPPQDCIDMKTTSYSLCIRSTFRLHLAFGHCSCQSSYFQRCVSRKRAVHDQLEGLSAVASSGNRSHTE